MLRAALVRTSIYFAAQSVEPLSPARQHTEQWGLVTSAMHGTPVTDELGVPLEVAPAQGVRSRLTA